MKTMNRMIRGEGVRPGTGALLSGTNNRLLSNANALSSRCPLMSTNGSRDARMNVCVPPAGNDLLSVLYEELRVLAGQKMARENPGQTLQATALVHEAWLR